jgi:hypothetical protein
VICWVAQQCLHIPRRTEASATSAGTGTYKGVRQRTWRICQSGHRNCECAGGDAQRGEGWPQASRQRPTSNSQLPRRLGPTSGVEGDDRIVVTTFTQFVRATPLGIGNWELAVDALFHRLGDYRPPASIFVLTVSARRSEDAVSWRRDERSSRRERRCGSGCPTPLQG